MGGNTIPESAPAHVTSSDRFENKKLGDLLFEVSPRIEGRLEGTFYFT